MKISVDEVRRVASLACLSFDGDGEARMAVEMSRILDYVDQIRDAASADEPPAAPASAGRVRDDEPGPSLPAAEVEAAAPRFERGHFVVPKVIGGE